MKRIKRPIILVTLEQDKYFKIMKTRFLILMLCFGITMSAQTTVVIMHSFYPHNVGKMKWYLGRAAVSNLDTTHWRNPKTIRESVLMFSSDSLHLPYEQKKLKDKLLGFFYNPTVISYTNGIFVLNTHKRIYKKMASILDIESLLKTTMMR